MPEQPSWVSIPSSQRKELDGLVASPGWSVVSGSRLPSVFPQTFREKIDSALVISAPTSTGGTYLVMSAHRVDQPARAIDREPFGVIVHSTGSSTAGVFVHHGMWKERTYPPPSSFWDNVEQSAVGNYFLAAPPSGTTSGSLDELPVGDRGAFDAVVRELRRKHDSE